ncbi:MAG: hypothetical protein JWQ00_2731 [Noviherbaspirillum sp.]|nr:hypothetical protein [Noviherbaspirillum sp.]
MTNALDVLRHATRHLHEDLEKQLDNAVAFPLRGRYIFTDVPADRRKTEYRKLPGAPVCPAAAAFSCHQSCAGNELCSDSTSWSDCTAAAPSPTAVATRLTELLRTSPTANIPGRLVSSE